MNAHTKPPAEPAPEKVVGEPLVPLNAAIFGSVHVELKVKLGEVAMTVEELLALQSGQILTLDRLISEPVDLYLEDAMVARGEIVAIDDKFGVRLVEVSDQR